MKRNSFIDITKIILCFLVVIIHFPFAGDWLIPIARIAVPLFFMFNGFFCAMGKSQEQDLKRAKKNLISSIKYLIFALVISGIHTIVTKIIEGNWTFYFYTWFCFALVTCALLNYLFVRHNQTKTYIIVGTILLFLCLLLGQYGKFIGLGNPSYFITRNGILTGFPFFAIGYFIAKQNLKLHTGSKIFLCFVGITFAIFQCIEINLIDPNRVGNGRIFISTIVSAVAIFIFVTHLPFTINTKWISPRIALDVYLTQFLIGDLILLFFSSPDYAVTLLVFGISLIVCNCGYFWCRKTKSTFIDKGR